MTQARAVVVAILAAAMFVIWSSASWAAAEPSEHVFDSLELPGVATMKVKAGHGGRPRFTWKTLDDAVEYTLVVQTLDGEPYWAWRGPAHRVFLGGEQRLPGDAAGPVLTRALQYQVTAFADDDRIVGASSWRVVTRG